MTIQKTTTSILSAIIFFSPIVIFAQVGIPCDGPNCDFNALIQLVNNIIKFLMFSVAIPLAALGFMFMGAKMVIMSNKESAKTEAKEGLGYILKGFLVMLGAYVFIKTILFAFITDEQKSFMNFMFQ